MSVNLYFVRHGQTILNKYNRMQGWCDSPLSEKGIQDASSAAKRLQHINFDAAYHSHTMRATITCKTIIDQNKNNHPNLEILDNFLEQGFGYFEGSNSDETWVMAGAQHGTKTMNDITKKFGFGATRDFLHEIDPFKDAETDKNFWNRINEGFDFIFNNYKDDENILIVSHSLVIRTIMDHFAPEFNAPINGPKNGSVTKLTINDDKTISVDYYNHYLGNQEY